MKAEERRELREWHRCVDNGEELLCFSCCNNYGESEPYPCDVIKVLDGYDKLAERVRELECQRWGTEFVMTCYQGTDIEEMRESLGMVLDNIDPSTGKPLDVEKWVVYE